MRGIDVANVTCGARIANVRRGNNNNLLYSPQREIKAVFDLMRVDIANVTRGVGISNVTHGVDIANVARGVDIANVTHGVDIANVTRDVDITSRMVSA